MSKQFTVVWTKWPGTPKISVLQPVGGSPSLGSPPIPSKEVTVERGSALLIKYEPLNAKSPARHETWEEAELVSGGMPTRSPSTV